MKKEENIKKETTQEMLEILYNQDLDIKNETGETVEVPEDGSIGLLALGYKGIIAWRKKRAENVNHLKP